MKKAEELTFDQGNTSEIFKLADGHNYFLHRHVRKEKPTLYALLNSDQGTTFTPYVTGHQMDKVLELRAGAGRKVDAAPDSISPTGFTCPGCGAVVTETGVHVGEPPAKKEEPKDGDPQCETCGSYDGKHIESCPKRPGYVKPSSSRFFK